MAYELLDETGLERFYTKFNSTHLIPQAYCASGNVTLSSQTYGTVSLPVSISTLKSYAQDFFCYMILTGDVENEILYPYISGSTLYFYSPRDQMGNRITVSTSGYSTSSYTASISITPITS